MPSKDPDYPEVGAALTPREQQILNVLCLTGSSNVDIASEVGCRPYTVTHHMNRILVKKGVRTRSALIIGCWEKRYNKLKEENDGLKKEISKIKCASNGLGKQASPTTNAA